MKATVFDFREVSRELRGELAMRAYELRHIRDQFAIGTVAEIHAASHSTLISEPVLATPACDLES